MLTLKLLLGLKNRFEMEEGVVTELQTALVKHQYSVFSPEETGTFEKQWLSCFDNFQHYLSGDTNQKAFIVRVFVAAENAAEFLRFSAQIKHTFSGTEIPLSVLSESPETPNLVMIEAGFVNSEEVSVDYGQIELVKFCKLSDSDYNEYWFAGVEGGINENSVAESSDRAFSQLLTVFNKLGIGFNNLVRQWNYVEQIFGITQIDNQFRQNYQLFNETRGEYYSKYRTIHAFPAATGIGVDFNGVTIECMAVVSDEYHSTIAISNPNQLNSYKYGQLVLKGEPQKNKTGNQPPQFERARLLTNGQTSRLFISGTASIVGQETIGLNDVEKQTHITIDNIELLTSQTNLKSHYPELKIFPDKYAFVRVYVKNEEDIPAVRSICKEHFGKVPMTIVKADICRADLLVEIEAEKTN